MKIRTRNTRKHIRAFLEAAAQGRNGIDAMDPPADAQANRPYIFGEES